MTKLNICLVLETSGGGSGRHVLDLVSGLRHRGHEIMTIWSPVRAEESWASELKSIKGVRNHELEMNRAIGVRDLSSIRNLSRVIRETGPYDIIHAHSSKAGALVRLLPRSIPGKRIYTPHAYASMDPSSSFLKQFVFSHIEQFLSYRTDTTIVVGEKERQHADKIGIRNPVATVVNGVNPGTMIVRSRARNLMGLSDRDFAVGFIGRMSKQKNPQRFLEVLRLATEYSESVKGIVIGDGELLEPLRALDIVPEDRINFMGWQNAAPLMPGLDAFLMTSRYEAMPYTLLEALASGLPILSTDVGGVEETIPQGDNGKIFPQDAANEDIALFISDLAKNKNLQSLYSQASANLSQQYTIDKMVDQTISVYEGQVQP